MKKAAAILFVLICLCASIFAQPKVAVLDTLIDVKMDQSVVVPVTEKIIERFVVSGSYKVLDRSNVRQVLSEREFQMSGMVSDAEITQAGRFLGADFVVVPRVQLIADTYFLTCKMINVETGVIANQASTEGEGKLSVLLGMAERVGATMAGAPVNGALATQQLAPPQQTPAPSTASPVKPTPAVAKPTVDPNRIGFRLYAGLGGGTQDLYTTGYTDEYHDSVGISLTALFPLWKIVVLAIDGTFLDSSSDETEFGGPIITSGTVGVGLALPLGILMPWASVKFGVPSAEWGVWNEVGAEFGYDVGLDVRLGSLLLGFRYLYETAAIAFVEEYTTIESNSFWLLAGFRF